ncbi:type I restriction enzyme S subunit [Tamilnaduibacter salinus]|uniref:Restriction endonuclease n=1 Tax=Tamilnaduibacter salinus TaxID=1484056 RepID=A0A2A2I8S7_9GAMM|nr:restriction endonuclease subunit S [Tamilnaduibacter salinus]PAV27540.1 restriction endonuclease [Tamilnaduibacter salinus]PVY77017.1 type I restriction enzyme S subunit [Tamilnaduibacter salinus]
MSYPSYPEYKDAGFVGLDQVPSHWAIVRFKQILKEVNRGSQTGEEQLLSVSEYYGVKPRMEVMEDGEHLSRAESLEGYKLCEPTDLVMNIMLAWKRGLGVSDHYGIVSPSYAVFRFVCEVHARYYHYLLRSDEYIGYFKTFSSGVIDSRLRLYPEVFGRLTGLYPPLNEQTQIARFLDHQTARIDALIAEQQRLIELLKEKRQAVISHAVTKGLDPDVAMKDSGVEWLGEVPEHWSVASLKHALELVADVDHYMPTPVDSGIPYVMTGDLRRFASEIDLDSCKKISRDEFLKLTRKIRTSEGDVIMARYATIGTVSYVDISKEFVVSYSCVTIRPQVNLVSGIYLFFYFQSDAFIQGISNAINANTQENVGVADLKEVKIALPGIREQKGIVDEVEAKLAKSDALVDKAERSIALMKERRSALISAAVTGKIDVRNWEPPVSETFPQSTASEEAPA